MKSDNYICDDRIDYVAFIRYVMSLSKEEFEKELEEAKKLDPETSHEMMLKRFPA